MTSIFFQISPTDFLEAMPIHNTIPGTGKDFALRIVSFASGAETYVYLPETTLNELSVLVTILRTRIVYGIRNINELRSAIFGVFLE